MAQHFTTAVKTEKDGTTHDVVHVDFPNGTLLIYPEGYNNTRIEIVGSLKPDSAPYVDKAIPLSSAITVRVGPADRPATEEKFREKMLREASHSKRVVEVPGIKIGGMYDVTVEDGEPWEDWQNNPVTVISKHSRGGEPFVICEDSFGVTFDIPESRLYASLQAQTYEEMRGYLNEALVLLTRASNSPLVGADRDRALELVVALHKLA